MGWSDLTDLIEAQVERARPFIDAGPRSAGAWLPSELLKIGFYVILSGRGGKESAAAFVDDLIEEARNRWAAGFYADPFAEPPLVREARG